MSPKTCHEVLHIRLELQAHILVIRLHVARLEELVTTQPLLQRLNLVEMHPIVRRILFCSHKQQAKEEATTLLQALLDAEEYGSS
jgi:hypothetical protein